MNTADFEQIASAVLLQRFPSFGSERELQDIIAARLERHNLLRDVRREFILSSKSRLDFFWEVKGIVIEVKIKGSLGALWSQIERYSQDERVKGIVIVGIRVQELPPLCNNKPVRIINLWSKMF